MLLVTTYLSSFLKHAGTRGNSSPAWWGDYSSFTGDKTEPHGIAVSFCVGCRCGSDPELLWLWLAAVARIRPPAWELYALSAALKRGKKKKKAMLGAGLGFEPMSDSKLRFFQ